MTDAGDLSLLREALDNVLTSTEYVEAPDACQAIVAAETGQTGEAAGRLRGQAPVKPIALAAAEEPA